MMKKSSYQILTTEQVAKRLNLSTATIYTYRTRGTMIEPDGFLGTTPYWSSTRIDWWAANRPKRGRPTTKAS